MYVSTKFAAISTLGGSIHHDIRRWEPYGIACCVGIQPYLSAPTLEIPPFVDEICYSQGWLQITHRFIHLRHALALNRGATALNHCECSDHCCVRTTTPIRLRYLLHVCLGSWTWYKLQIPGRAPDSWDVLPGHTCPRVCCRCSCRGLCIEMYMSI